MQWEWGCGLGWDTNPTKRSWLITLIDGTHIFQPDPLVEKEESILSWMLNDGEMSGLGVMKSSLCLPLAASINQEIVWGVRNLLLPPKPRC